MFRIRRYEPFFAPDGAEGGSEKVETEATEQKTTEAAAPKTETDSGSKSGNKGKAVTVEIEGVTYVVQEHVNKLIGDARNEGKQTGKAEYENEIKTKELQDQQQFKPLFEAEKTKREELETRIAEMELGAIRAKVGAKYQLPQRLVERLIGKNEAEIEADAKEVAKELGDVRKPVDTEGGQGSRVRGTGNRKAGEGEKPKRARPFAWQSSADVSWNREPVTER